MNNTGMKPFVTPPELNVTVPGSQKYYQPCASSGRFAEGRVF